MFPITYREIRLLVRKTVLKTPLARGILRKSGFVAGGGELGGLGALIMSTPPVIYVAGGVVSLPV
jgi:hypothetical protein